MEDLPLDIIYNLGSGVCLWAEHSDDNDDDDDDGDDSIYEILGRLNIRGHWRP